MSAAMLQAPVASCRSSFAGTQLRARAPARPQPALHRAARADTEVKPAPKKGEGKIKEPWKVPSLDPNTPSPIFGGSTGGLLRKAQVRPGCTAARHGRNGPGDAGRWPDRVHAGARRRSST